MNNLIIVLAFCVIIHAMNMAFPTRAERATECDTKLLAALFISKAFKAVTAYFKHKKNHVK